MVAPKGRQNKAKEGKIRRGKCKARQGQIKPMQSKARGYFWGGALKGCMGGGEVKKYKPQGQSKFLLGVRTLLRGEG